MGSTSDSPSDEVAVRRLLERLGSRTPAEAWSGFLEAYAGLVLQVVHRLEWDEEGRAECFVFVCEALRRHRCRRLRRFDPARGASFEGWLRLITHNLCRDWQRKRTGRFRPFKSLAEVSPLEQAVFAAVYERGLTADEAHETLVADFPELTAERVAAAIERIRSELSPRQLFLLSVRRPKVVSIERRRSAGDEPAEIQIADPAPDPEVLAALEERRARLAAALGRLTEEDRLLVSLRFEEGLTLARVAALAGLGNAQQADRRLREILARLRRDLEGDAG